MKLMVVAPYFYPKIGGMENYAWTIAKGLKEKYGWEVFAVTSNHEENKYKEDVIQGIKIYRLPILFKFSNTPINPMWYFSMKKIIAKEKPDAINAHSPVPFMADIAGAASDNIPFVLTYHAGSMKKNKGLIDMAISAYESTFLKSLFERSDKIVCYTQEFIDTNLKQFKPKIERITPGVDIALFNPAKTYVKNKVLFVGRIEKTSEWKGIKYLLDAMALIIKQNDKAILELVGSGDAVNDFKTYAKQLKIDKQVKFVGPLKGKKLADAYKNTSVLVLPSTSNAESFGMVIIEAMASGIPVIGSDIGGIPQVIDHKINGLLVEPKNSKSLAKAILTLLEDIPYSKTLGKNGYKKVKDNYDWLTKIELTKEQFPEAL